MIIATKTRATKSEAITFVNLDERPASILAAIEISKSIRTIKPDSYQGYLRLGTIPIGNFVRTQYVNTGCSGVRSLDVISSMLHVNRSKIHLPRTNVPLNIPITSLGDLGKPGPVHRLIGQPMTKHPKPRGTFIVSQYDGMPTYPILWKHDAKREQSLIVQPDSCGEVRPGKELEAVELWKTASKLHFNLDFRLNSQPLGACMTSEKSLGGTAWPSFLPHDFRHEIPLVLWCNTTLGLLVRWWSSSRQQLGRARTTVSTLSSQLVLDCRCLSNEQIAQCETLFDQLGDNEFLPANEAFRDRSRHALDHAFLFKILGFSSDFQESLILLRDQWCFEPSVHGGKKSRIGEDLDRSVHE